MNMRLPYLLKSDWRDERELLVATKRALETIHEWSEWKMQFIRLPATFGPSVTVEMITLSEVFSILPVMCHHMPPTNCRVCLRGMTASARHWLASNMKPLYQPASSRWLNLVLQQGRHRRPSDLTCLPFLWNIVAMWLHLIFLKGGYWTAHVVIWSMCCTIHVSVDLSAAVCVGGNALDAWNKRGCYDGQFTSSCFGDTLSGTLCSIILLC